jgi:hypothetical protein
MASLNKASYNCSNTCDCGRSSGTNTNYTKSPSLNTPTAPSTPTSDIKIEPSNADTKKIPDLRYGKDVALCIDYSGICFLLQPLIMILTLSMMMFVGALAQRQCKVPDMVIHDIVSKLHGIHYQPKIVVLFILLVIHRQVYHLYGHVVVNVIIC